MSDRYQGPVRILDELGVLLTVGTADLSYDPELDHWSGNLEVVAGSGVAGKGLVVQIEADGRRGRAQLKPVDNREPYAHSQVIGLGPKPF
ncbi:MAG TPA: hypothetical protein VJR05_07115 [Acidimicrobiia bacterium]|nr:hypothetical protein [Acidimicrobiia bacterium]